MAWYLAQVDSPRKLNHFIIKYVVVAIQLLNVFEPEPKAAA